MLNKKITILVLCLAVMTVVSGCGKKEVKPFFYNDFINKIPPVIEDNNINDLKNNEVKDLKKEIEEIATTTKEVMDYIEYEKINTSDWLTYYSKEYGFEIKYPKGWIVEGKEEQTQQGKLEKIIIIHNPHSQDENRAVSMLISKGESSYNSGGKSISKSILLDNIFIGKYKTYIAYKNDNLNQWFYRYFIRTKNDNLQFRFVPTKNTKKEIFYKILNTIKFDE